MWWTGAPRRRGSGTGWRGRGWWWGGGTTWRVALEIRRKWGRVRASAPPPTGTPCRDQLPPPRIAPDPARLTGKPVVRGTRILVKFAIGLLAEGWEAADVPVAYPALTQGYIAACLGYGGTGP